MSLPTVFPSNTPFANFAHCPRCSAQALTKCGERAIVCGVCGFKYYFNCASAVGALLLFQGKLVLGVRGIAPQKGMLDLPGGFIEFDESVEEALAREVFEELNVKITDPVYLASAPNDYHYAGVHYKTTDLFFACEVDDISTIKAGDDLEAYEIIAPDEIDPKQLAFPSSRIALQKLLDRLQCTRR